MSRFPSAREMLSACLRHFMVLVLCVVFLGAANDEAVADEFEPKGQQSAFSDKDFRQLLYHVLEATNGRFRDHPSPGLALVEVDGRVLNADGQPAKGVKLALGTPRSHVDASYRINLDVTDDQGRFFLRGLPEQTRLVLSTETIPQWELTLPTEREQWTIRLPKLSTLKFECEDGDQMGERRVTLRSAEKRKPYATPRSESLKLLKPPAATTKQVLPGEYHVTYSRSRNEDGKREVLAVESRMVTVKPGERATVRCGQSAGCRLVGRVKGLAEFPQPIKLIFVCDGHADETKPDKKGNYRSPPLPAGRCLVRIERATQPSPFNNRFAPSALLRKLHVQVPDAETHQQDLALRAPVPATTAEAVRGILDQPSGRLRNDPRIQQLANIKDRSAVVDALLRELFDQEAEWSNRQFVVRVLGQLKPPSPAMLAGLLRALDEPELESMRTSLAYAMAECQVDGGELFERLITLSHDPSIPFRGGIVEALGRIGSQSESAKPRVVQALTVSLTDPDGRVRQRAADHLGRLMAKSAAKALEKLAVDPYASARVMALWSHYRVTDKVDPAVAVLADVLQGDDYDGRWMAAMALTTFDKRAAAAIPALRENANFNLKPPFRNERDSLKWRIQANAKRALAAIE